MRSRRIATSKTPLCGRRIKVKLYPGARHELLNETFSAEVTSDFVLWIDATLRLR